ncbi:hypothetical protein M2153_003886 [Pseudomonas sp. JUb96]|nr:hypothetical protein [Pseudomonas sp. JUb96]
MPQIIDKVLGQHRIFDRKLITTATYSPREYCVQAGETDLQFLARLAAEEGLLSNGPQDLPEPPPLQPRLSRRQTTFRRFHEWRHSFRSSLTSTRGKLWAPIMVPLRLLWLIWDVFPEYLTELIQYNVPYTTFPRAIDELCGFAEKRKPVIRVNGKIVDR